MEVRASDLFAHIDRERTREGRLAVPHISISQGGYWLVEHMECDAVLPAGGHRFFGGRAAKLPGHPVQDNDSPAREDAT